MMKSEFVRIVGAEKVFGQKNLLQSQLQLLNIVKSFKKYKQFRKEELVLKVSLKNKIEDAISSVAKLKRLMPKTAYRSEEIEGVKKSERINFTLQEEILNIQTKLERLQSGF